MSVACYAGDMRAVKPFLPVLIAVASCAKESGAPASDSSSKAPPAVSSQANLSEHPEACQGCHPTIYAEYKETMHARSHHSNDPIYAGVRQLRVAKEGDKITTVCGQCHNPRSPQRPETAAAKTGVSCATCHNLKSIRRLPGMFGAQLLQWAAPNVFLGPHQLGKKKIDAHGLGYAPPHMQDGVALCLTCHAELKNAADVALCTTGTEWKAAGDAQTCVACHMPLAPGPGTINGRPDYHRSHRFFGPRAGGDNAEWAPAKRGVELEAAFVGSKLAVTLNNRTQHGYPTGFPGRMLIVKAVGFDRGAKRIWTNFDSNPMKESPESVLNKVYVDDEQKPTIAAFAKALKRDTRLKPGEKRTLTFDVPASVERAEIDLMLRLLPPPLAQKFKLEEAGLGGVRSIAKTAATRAK